MELTCREASNNTARVWVGAEDNAIEGRWVWPDGSELSDTDEIWAASIMPDGIYKKDHDARVRLFPIFPPHFQHLACCSLMCARGERPGRGKHAP